MDRDRGMEANNEEAGAGYRWLTYRELADRLGVSLAAAESRARRSKWPKRPGNDGSMRIAVPATMLDAPAGTMELLAALKAAHKATAALLRQRAEEAEARLAAMEARVAEAEARAETAQQGTASAVAIMGRLVRKVEEIHLERAEDAKAVAADRARLREALSRAEDAQAATIEARERFEALQQEVLTDAEARVAAAEKRAAEAVTRAEEAERQARVATNRLDDFQRERLNQAQAAAEAARAASTKPKSFWARLLGRD